MCAICAHDDQRSAMKITLYGNGAAGNHGCEAIVRGTVELLPETSEFLVLSDDAAEERQYGLDQLAQICPATCERKRDAAFLAAYTKLKLTGNYVDMDGLYYLPAIKAQKGETRVALSAGGDNYCYGGAAFYAWLNRAYHRQGIKTVLWGCSVEPEVAAQPQVARDLARYDAVVARESITYEAIRAVQKNTVLAPDPAFYMKPKLCALDERWDSGDVIGINISPMIVSSEKVSGMAYENYRRLVAHILKTTQSYVALIPHVVWERNDDRAVLQRLYEDFNRDPRLILVEDHTAPELKHIISQCAFFVGARTHATIAAYSTCVPTLVVGYSVKARGIARDLFGTEEGYVLPVQDLRDPGQLTAAFDALYGRRAEIREHLEKTLPEYLQAGAEAVEAVKKLKE